MKGIRADSAIEFEVAVMNDDIHYKQVEDLNIKIHYLLRSRKNDLSVFSRFFKICKNYRPDIVHCWDSMTATIAIPACKMLHIKLVNGLVVDTPVKHTIFDKYWLRAKITFLFSNVVIGNSNAGLRAYKAPKKKSVCIYNGMDLSRFISLKEKDLLRKEILNGSADHNIVGMVAAFEERKDYTTLIKAALRLIHNNSPTKFVLVGDGPNFEKIKTMIPADNADKILLLGKRSDIESLVNIFDIGVLLTNSNVHGEGISNSIIEYMALGKPVIATRGGGTNEVVIENKNGYLVDCGNADQLAEKIQDLLGNKEKMKQLGKAGSDMVKEKFDLKIMTRQYLGIYNKLVTE